MPKLVAKERFYYNGRNVETGELFDALEQDVALLTHSVSPRATVPTTSEPHAAARRQQPKTKVLKAETGEASTGHDDHLLEGQQGRYHRTDMRAED